MQNSILLYSWQWHVTQQTQIECIIVFWQRNCYTVLHYTYTTYLVKTEQIIYSFRVTPPPKKKKKKEKNLGMPIMQNFLQLFHKSANSELDASKNWAKSLIHCVIKFFGWFYKMST